MSIFSRIIKKSINIPITAKASFSYIVCNIIQKSLSVITLPIFARLLTTEQYGQCVIYTSWSTLLTIFLTFNVGHGSFSRAMIKYEKDRDGYVTACQGFCLSLTVIFLVFYSVFGNVLNRLFELPTYIVVIMVLEIFSQSLITIWYERNKFDYKYNKVVILTLVLSVCSPVLAYLLICNFAEKGFARILGYAIPGIAAGLVLFISNLIKKNTLFSKEYWSYIVSINAPLLIYYLSQMIFNHSDKLIIDQLSGKSAAGLYGFAFSISMILNFVLNAINGSYIPWMYRTIKEKKYSDNKRISTDIAILLALMLLCVIWFAPEITLIFGGQKYADAIYCVPALTMSFIFIYYAQLFVNVEFYYEKKNSLILASVIPAIVNIILNYIFIPVFGFVVASYTTLFSYVVFVLLNYQEFRKLSLIENTINELFDYKKLLIIAFLFLASGFLGVFLYNNLLIRILITLIVFVAFLYFGQKELKKYNININL